MKISEYPDPQFRRRSFVSLNGVWEFEIGDFHGRTGIPLSGKINVPFCPESELSGLAHTDFIVDCAYSRTLKLTEKDLAERLVLHFGAVDYEAEVYINGRKAFAHRGGYTPFEGDIAPYAKVGENRITVLVHDDVRNNQPSGKQSERKESYGCFYTRTTGIWQSVWLESTPRNYIRSLRFFTDVEKESVDVEVNVEGGGKAVVRILYDGREVGKAERDIYYRGLLTVGLSEIHLWEPGNGRLYDVIVSFEGDETESYFGLRTTEFAGRKFLLNGRSVFQRFVLDQGFYKAGIYTASGYDELERDIRLSAELGFNGARLHQKLFDPRFLYACDRMGYMVWGEYASWGVRYENLEALGTFVAEWSEAVQRDFNHPSVVVWCPLNEAWENLSDKKRIRDVRFVEAIYHLTKTLDPTRPCVDTSGGYHGKYTDIFDFHCYDKSENFLGKMADLTEKNELTMDLLYAPAENGERILYDGRAPVSASEYGGIAYVVNGKGWGYHSTGSEEAFVEEYVKLTKTLLDNPKICGFCYTQLYDVEQEQNGLYTYERKTKFSQKAMKAIAECNQSEAAIEK